MLIICDDKIPFIRGVFEPYADVVYLPGGETTPGIVKDADAIVTRTRTICNSSLLEGSKVKVIASATIGYDHIDTRWCEANGITWSNAPGCNSGSVAQYIASVLIRLADKHNLQLDGMTLGVVGVGHVGSKVVKVGQALGMKVLQCDPPRARMEGAQQYVSLDTIISESDIITLHVPLDKEGPDATYHLFDSKTIEKLGPTQILINSSRGPVVDNAALKDALTTHKLKGAVLDVWENEPDIDTGLLSLLEYGTPHIAGYSADGKANGTSMAVQTVAEALDLPLKDFKVAEIPSPGYSPTSFAIDASGKTTRQVLAEAILHTYDISEDSDRLRSNPEEFERQRGEYPVRREPAAFTVNLTNSSAFQEASLEALGFNIITTK